MTHNTLSTALDALFADPPAAEAGGYGAPRAGIKGGREWARLVKGAMQGGQGTLGSISLDLASPFSVTVRQTQDKTLKLSIHSGWVLTFLGEVSLHSPGVVHICDQSTILVENTPLRFSGAWGAIVAAIHLAICEASCPTGLSLDDKTLRATSPTDITLALEGDTVVATFNPPLKATKSIEVFDKPVFSVTRNVGRLNITEEQVHVVVDDGPDAWIGLEE